MPKYKVSVNESVTIPATDTSTPERQYSFVDFFDQFVLHGELMRTEEGFPLLSRICDVWLQPDRPDYVELDEQLFMAAKSSAKYEIDKLMTADRGRQPLPMQVAMPILKLYHQFAKSPLIPEAQ